MFPLMWKKVWCSSESPSKELKTDTQNITCMFIAALFTVANYPSTDEWVQKFRYIRAINVVQPQKGKKYGYLLQHRWTWKTFCKMKEARNKIHCIFLYMKSYKMKWNLPNRRSIETEWRLVVVRGWREEVLGRDCLMSKGFHFGLMEIFWNYIELLSWKCTNC